MNSRALTFVIYDGFDGLDLAASLAEGDDPVDTIARRCGFGTAETLRRTFHRLVGIAPSEYRDRFRTTSVTASPPPAPEVSRPARPVHLEEVSS